MLKLFSSEWYQEVAIKMIVRIYPVGSYFTQYPSEANNTDSVEFPESQRPANLFGGTWEEQWSTESNYFRTGGSQSDAGRTSGRQLDAMQRITGEFYYSGSSTGVQWLTDTTAQGSGVWTPTRQYTSTTIANGPTNQNIFKGFTFDNAGSPSSRTSSATSGETRVTNRRVKVWKRVA
jgi:hypothetical protein